MEVHRHLGCGFLEAVYENSLIFEFEKKQIEFRRQAPLDINYKGKDVGRYIADLVVEEQLLLELKANSRLTPFCEAQLLNYLTASGLGAGFSSISGRDHFR